MHRENSNYLQRKWVNFQVTFSQTSNKPSLRRSLKGGCHKEAEYAEQEEWEEHWFGDWVTREEDAERYDRMRIP